MRDEADTSANGSPAACTSPTSSAAPGITSICASASRSSIVPTSSALTSSVERVVPERVRMYWAEYAMELPMIAF